MDHRQTLIDCCKAAEAIGDADITPEHVAAECDAIRDAILRVLYEVDVTAYFECMEYSVDAARSEPASS